MSPPFFETPSSSDEGVFLCATSRFKGATNARISMVHAGDAEVDAEDAGEGEISGSHERLGVHAATRRFPQRSPRERNFWLINP